MLKNTLVNRIAIKTIAQALGELNDRVIYVGGAVVSLYIDDPAAEDLRPTKDLDISLEIANLSELEAIRGELIQKGFYQSHKDSVICRFRYEDILVDVMATKAVGWAPANPWFEEGFKNLITFDIDGHSIKCLSLPYFLASKFSAFYDRGVKNARLSKDFEDIVYILNYTNDLEEFIQNADETVKSYLCDCIKDILSDKHKQEAILANLYFEERYQKIIKTLEAIINGI